MTACDSSFYVDGIKIRSRQASVNVNGRQLLIVAGADSPADGEIHFNQIDDGSSIHITGFTTPLTWSSGGQARHHRHFDAGALQRQFGDEYEQIVEYAARNLPAKGSKESRGYARAVADAYCNTLELQGCARTLGEHRGALIAASVPELDAIGNGNPGALAAIGGALLTGITVSDREAIAQLLNIQYHITASQSGWSEDGTRMNTQWRAGGMADELVNTLVRKLEDQAAAITSFAELEQFQNDLGAVSTIDPDGLGARLSRLVTLVAARVAAGDEGGRGRPLLPEAKQKLDDRTASFPSFGQRIGEELRRRHPLIKAEWQHLEMWTQQPMSMNPVSSSRQICTIWRTEIDHDGTVRTYYGWLPGNTTVTADVGIKCLEQVLHRDTYAAFTAEHPVQMYAWDFGNGCRLQNDRVDVRKMVENHSLIAARALAELPADMQL